MDRAEVELPMPTSAMSTTAHVSAAKSSSHVSTAKPTAHVPTAEPTAHVSAAEPAAHVSTAGESGAKPSSPIPDTAEPAVAPPHRPHLMHGTAERAHRRRSRMGLTDVVSPHAETRVLEGLIPLMGLADVIGESCMTRMIRSTKPSRLIRAEPLVMRQGRPRCRMRERGTSRRVSGGTG
jgi:hypothetical protein